MIKIVLMLMLVASVGFFRDWYSIYPAGSGSEVKMSVNRSQIRSDEQRLKRSALRLKAKTRLILANAQRV